MLDEALAAPTSQYRPWLHGLYRGLGLYRVIFDDGKEHGNYYLEFRVVTPTVRRTVCSTRANSGSFSELWISILFLYCPGSNLKFGFCVEASVFWGK